MKAAVVTGRRRFEIRELPTPEVQKAFDSLYSGENLLVMLEP